jgi:hypothetical protein
MSSLSEMVLSEAELSTKVAPLTSAEEDPSGDPSSVRQNHERMTLDKTPFLET